MKVELLLIASLTWILNVTWNLILKHYYYKITLSQIYAKDKD